MDERGGAASVEMALLWAAMLLMILAVIQAALLAYAGQLALSAAEDGVSSGRSYGARSIVDTARREAEDFLRRAGGTTLTDVAVSATVDESAGLLRVRVSGTTMSLVPGVSLSVSREAVGGLERVTP